MNDLTHGFLAVLAAPVLMLLAGCSSSEPPPSDGIEASRPGPVAVDSAIHEAGSTESASLPAPMQDFYALELRSLEGEPLDLEQYRGKVALVVNVASRCGYTPQYTGLQDLHEQMRDQGLVVLGVPCNDFGGQEPGSPAEIREFCSSRYQVSFPMLEKAQTRAGPGQSPVYRLLEQATGELPSWNFGKYLVGKDGRVLAYFPSGVAPESAELREAIAAALES